MDKCAGVERACGPTTLHQYCDKVVETQGRWQNLMHFEWARFQSFNTFPKTSSVSTLRLASEGFYFTGVRETVKCFSCGVGIDSWKKWESIRDKHRRLSPDCDFVNGRDTRNVPIRTENGQDNARLVLNHSHQQAQAANGGPNDTWTPETSLAESTGTHSGVPANNSEGNDRTVRKGTQAPSTTKTVIPRHPEFSRTEVRQSSYIRWPHDFLDPNILAACGLFYTGVEDRTRCFQCGGGLRNWDPGDDPWREHARWFPQCDHIRHVRGQEFINACLRGETSQKKDLKENEATPSQEPGHGHESMVIDRIVAMGYSQAQVLVAANAVRQTHGTQRVTEEDIIDYLISNESHENLSVNTAPSQLADRQAEVAETRLKSEQEKNQDVEPKQKEMVKKEGRSTCPGNERKTLAEENRQLREQMMCKICMDRDACVVFLPCGHMVSCDQCAKALRKCAVCRRYIQGTVRAFPS